MVIPHTEILLDGIIFAGGDIDRIIPSIAQTLCNKTGIPPVCLDPLSPLRQHSRRRKNDTFDTGTRELVVQSISEAACLVTAFKRIFIGKTEFHFNGSDKSHDGLVIRSDLYLSVDPVFCSEYRLHCAKSVVSTMDIHTDFDYSIH